VNGIGSFSSSSNSRITGLSGFDTEATVKSLMDAEKIPLTLAQQKRQVLEWRQEAYRDVTTTLRGFKSTYFDVLSSATNMLSGNAIRSLAAKSSADAHVSATATGDAEAGTHTVKVNQLATADTATSTGNITKALTGTVANLDMTGKTFYATLDGVTRQFALSNYSGNDIGVALQTAMNTAFGTGKVTVSYDGGTSPNGHLTFSTSGGATKFTLNSTSATDTGLAMLGFSDGSANRISLGSSLESLSSKLGAGMTFDGDNVKFSINGKSFSFSKSTSLSSVMSTVNGDATANVRMSYDETSDRFTIKSRQLGAGDNLTLTESTSSFFAALGINKASPVTTQGQDAIVTIDGTELVRNSNSFSVNGINYTLNKVHDATATGETITVSQDVDAAVSKLKGFVEKYNALLDSLNGKVGEKYDRNYMPLTDAQREAMSVDDIAAWEKKAKTGLLANDGIVGKIARDMRKAMTDIVSDAGLTLRDIGISSSSYEDKGKLTIDESKLRNALQNKPEQVSKLLNGASGSVGSYTRTLTAPERSTRYAESGVLQRLSDIIDDNISTMRDVDGNKGFLLEKAGIKGDLSFSDNTIYDELKTYDKKIATLLDRLTDKETSYYKRFSALESALQKMNQQSSWLMSQLGSSG